MAPHWFGWFCLQNDTDVPYSVPYSVPWSGRILMPPPPPAIPPKHPVVHLQETAGFPLSLLCIHGFSYSELSHLSFLDLATSSRLKAQLRLYHLFPWTSSPPCRISAPCLSLSACLHQCRRGKGRSCVGNAEHPSLSRSPKGLPPAEPMCPYGTRESWYWISSALTSGWRQVEAHRENLAPSDLERA